MESILISSNYLKILESLQARIKIVQIRIILWFISRIYSKYWKIGTTKNLKQSSMQNTFRIIRIWFVYPKGYRRSLYQKYSSSFKSIKIRSILWLIFSFIHYKYWKIRTRKNLKQSSIQNTFTIIRIRFVHLKGYRRSLYQKYSSSFKSTKIRSILWLVFSCIHYKYWKIRTRKKLKQSSIQNTFTIISPTLLNYKIK